MSNIIEEMKSELTPQAFWKSISEPEIVLGAYVAEHLCGYGLSLTAAQAFKVILPYGIYVEDGKLMHVGRFQAYPAGEIKNITPLDYVIDKACQDFARYRETDMSLPFEVWTKTYYIQDCGWSVPDIPSGALEAEAPNDPCGLICPLPVKYVLKKGIKYYKGWPLVECRFDKVYGPRDPEMSECRDYDQASYVKAGLSPYPVLYDIPDVPVL